MTTPRSRPSKPEEPGTRGPTPAFPIASILVALLLIVVLAQAVMAPGSGREISYSEFKSELRAGRVTELTVGESRITGVLVTGPSSGAGEGERFTTVRVDDPKLIEELEARGVEYSGEVSRIWLLEMFGWLLPLMLILVFWGLMFRRLGGTGGAAMTFGRSRAKIYAEKEVSVSFADVAGVDEATDELKEIVDFLRNPKKYTDLGGSIPKGVLLVGPPGTGKTLLARAVAGEASVPFFSLSGSEFVEMFVGVGAARVRDLFAQAEGRAPCIVFIDELDALGKIRGPAILGSHEEREQTLNQLLAEMDGFDPRKGVIVMAATNRPEVLDPALLRPGRFDRQVLVDKPDVRGREAILRLHARTVKVAPGVDLEVLAARTPGFAGADLANLVNEAALLAARRDRTAVEMTDFEEAIERLVAGLEKKRVMRPQEREIVAFHESGHAIVASEVKGVDPVHKVSIVQRGFGALGYTLQLPLEERYLMTRSELESQLAVMLGGRAAEELVFDEVSTGAENDLQRATEMARAMVSRFGMSESLGAVSYAGTRQRRFLEADSHEPAPWAPSTMEAIDAEIRRLVDEAHARARRVLEARRGSLAAVAERLLEQEVVEGSELKELLSRAHTPPGSSAPAVAVRASR